ncbi:MULTISPECIES: hypothetical protein [Actinosynnema]|uniref:hypothetical protein n=1 Tax=Actinosynnema TaxID=40566 RepID=UPI0020A598B4|nr:hypothetical protein [Actinosynnema pretiosum]MCP2092626.1 hypothetical protein [Actinosynnema pretiosum]
MTGGRAKSAATTALLVLPCLAVGLIALLGHDDVLPGRAGAASGVAASNAEATAGTTTTGASEPSTAEPTPSPTTAVSATTTTTTTAPPNTPEQPVEPIPPLDTPAPDDLDGRWVAQLFSVAVDQPPSVLEARLLEFSLRTGSDIPVLLSSDYSALRPGYLVGYHPGPFADSAAVTAWCADLGLPTADCLPRQLTR